MARAVVKPKSDVYVGMIATICGAMLVGIGCAALELMEYDSGKPPASGLPTPEKLRGDMKPLDDGGGGSIKYGTTGMAPQPADPTRVTAAPTTPADVPAVAPPAMLPQLPVAANPPAAAPSGPTPSPLALPPATTPAVPANSPPAGPTPSPLNLPRSPRI